jgi:hypothetical protein
LVKAKIWTPPEVSGTTFPVHAEPDHLTERALLVDGPGICGDEERSQPRRVWKRGFHSSSVFSTRS